MSSLRWLIQLSILIFSSTPAWTKEASTSQLKREFTVSTGGDQQIIIDERSLRDDHFAYGQCTFKPDGSMTCTIVLNHIHRGKIDTDMCETSQKSNDTSEILRDKFQLKYLFGNNMIMFAWSELGAMRNTIVRTLNMTDCRYNDTMIPYVSVDRKELIVLPYADTYDLFYRNESACGLDYMCGQTIDAKGRVLNGPVPSYLKIKYFYGSVAVGTVERRSSRLGHYLLNHDARIVSAYAGRDVLLVTNPKDADYKAFSMEHGKLGLCFIAKRRKQLTCLQFDRNGLANLTFSQNLDTVPGPIMAMYNLPKGGILLLTSECEDEAWCRDNLDRVPFKLVKIQMNGTKEDVFAFKGIGCNGSDELHIDVKGVTKDNAGVSFACRVDRSETEVVVYVLHYYVSI